MGLAVVIVVVGALVSGGQQGDPPSSPAEQGEQNRGPRRLRRRPPSRTPNQRPRPTQRPRRSRSRTRAGPRRTGVLWQPVAGHRTFRALSGAVACRGLHEGEGTIWIDLVDTTGESYSLLADEGPFDVSQAEHIEEAGTYVVEVTLLDGGGAWEVRLQQ